MEYEHDSVRLTYLLPAQGGVDFVKGLPVRIRYGWTLASTESFFGYVHHTAVETQVGKTKLLHVFIVACSYRLNEMGTYSYLNKTLPQIVASVANRNQFSATIGQDHHNVQRNIAQRGKSDFTFLVDQAKAHGNVFYAHNTDLVMRERRIEKCAGRIPTFRYDPTKYNTHNFILDFYRTLNRDTDDREQVSHGVSFSGRHLGSKNKAVAIRTGRRKARRSPFHHIDRSVVRNLDEARHAAEAAAELNRFNITATAVCSGDPRVQQATVVRFLGISTQDNGLWYVVQAEHIINPVTLRYTLELTLARDSLGQVPEDFDVTTPDGRVIVVDSRTTPIDNYNTSSTSTPNTIYEPVARTPSLDPTSTSAGPWFWRARRFAVRPFRC